MPKGKRSIYNSSSSRNAVDDDEDEEESQEDEEADTKSEDEEEEEEPESQEEECEEEESESDPEGDTDSDESSDEDEDEDYESVSDGDEDGDGDRREGKLTNEDLCDKVVNLLRQRNKKLDVLKLEECKAYLRKHELMISGTKATCVQRILEHWRLKDGNGEMLYPKSSFTINCTGDVCKGDVVMFKQRVYEKFNKVSRNGKVIGKRTIVGRVVKESYGSAKQQHTFTVEVLWSKGMKRLPPLYPLLVKGRNLYRYRTFRQHWGNEAERSKVLEEKHRRGATARHVRASTKARISAGSKRQSSLTDSKQHQIKRLKKHSEASTPRKKQQKTYNAKTQVKTSSNNKHLASSSSVKHSKKFKTKTSSNTNMRQIDQSAQRPTFQNIYDNSHTDLHQRNNIGAPQAGRERFLNPVYNYNHKAGHTVPPMREPHYQLMNRGRNIRQSYSVSASQFDQRGHLIHPYSNSISQYDLRSSSHFFTPEVHDQRFAGFQFHGRSQPWQ